MGISLGQTTLELMTLTDLAMAMSLCYKFLKGTGGWIGYVIAAVYYFGFDLGYAEYLCTAMQYGYIVIYWLNVVVSFGQAFEAA